MILVPVEVRSSTIHGLGCFLTAPVQKGTVVMNWDAREDYSLTPEQYDALPEPLRRHLDHYVWLYRGQYYGTSGLGRFTNHSKTPNLVFDPALEATVAAKDIEIGEELTEDYGQYDASFTGF